MKRYGGFTGGWLTFWVTVSCTTAMALFGYDQGVFGRAWTDCFHSRAFEYDTSIILIPCRRCDHHRRLPGNSQTEGRHQHGGHRDLVVRCWMLLRCHLGVHLGRATWPEARNSPRNCCHDGRRRHPDDRIHRSTNDRWTVGVLIFCSICHADLLVHRLITGLGNGLNSTKSPFPPRWLLLTG